MKSLPARIFLSALLLLSLASPSFAASAPPGWFMPPPAKVAALSLQGPTQAKATLQLTPVWIHGGTGGGLACPANDGSAGAPNASPAQPSLLNGYTKTIASALGCKVAGVSSGYGVGITTGTSLTDWQSLSGTGITVNAGTGIVTYGAGSTCDAEGIDFSLHNGAWLYFHGCANPTAKNDKFICGSLCISNMSIGVITADSCSGNVNISKNFIDGGSQNSANQATLVSVNCTGSGTFTFQYNQLQNFSQQVLELDNSATLLYEYNLIVNGAQASGAHLNYLQLLTGTYTITVAFNTSLQQPQTSSGEGYQFYNGAVGLGTTLASPTFKYNTMVATTPTGTMSNMVHGFCHSAGDCSSSLATITGTADFSYNFFDPTGDLDGTDAHVFYPSGGSQMWTGANLSNNSDMVTGAAITNNP